MNRYFGVNRLRNGGQTYGVAGKNGAAGRVLPGA